MSNAKHHSASVQITCVLLSNGPNHKHRDTSDLGMPEKKPKVFSLNEKENLFNLREEKNYMLKFLRPTENMNAPFMQLLKKL